MDDDALAEARAKAQDALSRARLATDPAAKKLWEDLAEEWMERLFVLESADPQFFAYGDVGGRENFN
jgi:hypothetical protein